jgi:hypothetical protein
MRSLKAAIVAIGLWGQVLLAIPCVEAQQIIVGENVLVSKEQEKMHSETLLAADPKDSNRLLGCAMIWLDGARRRTTIVYASFDGGKNWEPTLDTRGFFDSADPAITFGPDGAAYYSVIANTYPDSYPVMQIYRSTNGGKTWLPPTSIPYIDREYITADNTGGKYHGRIYINGSGVVHSLEGAKAASNVGVYSSRDGGRTFPGPVNRASLGGGWVSGRVMA